MGLRMRNLRTQRTKPPPHVVALPTHRRSRRQEAGSAESSQSARALFIRLQNDAPPLQCLEEDAETRTLPTVFHQLLALSVSLGSVLISRNRLRGRVDLVLVLPLEFAVQRLQTTRGAALVDLLIGPLRQQPALHGVHANREQQPAPIDPAILLTDLPPNPFDDAFDKDGNLHWTSTNVPRNAKVGVLRTVRVDLDNQVLAELERASVTPLLKVAEHVLPIAVFLPPPARGWVPIRLQRADSGLTWMDPFEITQEYRLQDRLVRDALAHDRKISAVATRAHP